MVQKSYSTEKVVYPTIDEVLKKSQVVQESLPLGPFFLSVFKGHYSLNPGSEPNMFPLDGGKLQ